MFYKICLENVQAIQYTGHLKKDIGKNVLFIKAYKDGIIFKEDKEVYVITKLGSPVRLELTKKGKALQGDYIVSFADGHIGVVRYDFFHANYEICNEKSTL